MSWWTPPRLKTGKAEGERHATWLELFFDLVFVVAVAELAHLLHDDLTPRGLLIFAALFVPIWWQWIDFSYYGDQYDTDDVSYRLSLLAAMLGIVVLALTIADVAHGDSRGFALAYVALRVLIVALYDRARRHVPEARELATRYAISFTLALGVWVASLAVPEPWRYVLWSVALLIEIGNGPVTYATITQVPRQESHMDERFGLFVIIVLGEAVIAVVTGVGDTDWKVGPTLVGLAGFVVGAALWWLYFGRADPTVITRALRGGRRELLLSYVYGYGHLPVFAGITAAGVGFEAAIEEAGHGTLTTGGALVVVAGLLAYLAGVTALQWAAAGTIARGILDARVGAAVVVVAVGLLGRVVAAEAVVALAVLLVALVVVEGRTAGRAPA